jgi:hypothetical protein
MKMRLGKKPLLVKNLLLVEGITRAGKFLLANILNGFDGIEPVQLYGLLEQIPLWANFGLIDKNTAKEILKLEIDTHCYEMLIGRNLNYRTSDKSSVFNIPCFQKYLARSKEKNIDKIMEKYNREKPFSFFIMHELMPNISIYFETFPELKVVSMRRGPIDLVSSWYKRGAGRRYGTDPKVFKIPFKGKHGHTPWFLPQWNELSEIDRIIFSIKKLFDMYEASYRHLSSKYKKKILLVSYEDLLNNPKSVIGKLSNFLDKKPLSEMKLILKREKLPATEKLELKVQKLKEIKKIASKKYFNILIKMENKYLSQ